MPTGEDKLKEMLEVEGATLLKEEGGNNRHGGPPL